MQIRIESVPPIGADRDPTVSTFLCFALPSAQNTSIFESFRVQKTDAANTGMYERHPFQSATNGKDIPSPNPVTSRTTLHMSCYLVCFEMNLPEIPFRL